MLFKQNGLLPADSFVEGCKAHGLPVTELELEYYEQRGLLYPLLRVPRPVTWHRMDGSGRADPPTGSTRPDGIVPTYGVYSTHSEALQILLEEGLLEQPAQQPFVPWRDRRDPQTSQDTVATYYVLYQTLQVRWIRQMLTIEETWERPGPDDEWPNKVVRVLSDRLPSREQDLRQEVFEMSELIAFFLAIQNRYRPGVTELISNYRDVDEYNGYVAAFVAESVIEKVPMPLDKLRDWRQYLRREGRDTDPLREWVELVRYMGPQKRKELRGTALMAQELYTAAEMISRFLRDLARERGEDEPDRERQHELEYQRTRYGRELNYYDRDILETILTEYDLNPRPHVLFVIEGDTEELVLPVILEAMGIRLETFGIEVHKIGGVDNDLGVLTLFAAPPQLGHPVRPGLYRAGRQTRIYGLFDREGKWCDDTAAARRIAGMKERLRAQLPTDLPDDAKDIATDRGVTVERWQRNFEYDNFSDDELAAAINAYIAEQTDPRWSGISVTAAEVAAYRAGFFRKPPKKLDRIVAEKMKSAGFDINKKELGKLLASMVADKVRAVPPGALPAVPIVEKIRAVVELAQQNWP